MSPEAFGNVEVRLQTLERRLRLIAVAWAASLLGFPLLISDAAPAASSPAVVRARAVEVVDEAGRTRAALAVRHDVALLRLADAEGRPRLELFVFPDGAPGLQLHDAEGRGRLRLGVGPAGEPALWLFDILERPRMGLKVLSSGVPRIWLFDPATGQVFFQAP